MKSILDKDFEYTNAACTDIRKTFRRVRRELEKEGNNGVRSGVPVRLVTGGVVPGSSVKSGRGR